jgi:transcriptional regulator with XRE-family HTH domain
VADAIRTERARLGRRLREIREKRGLTQEQAAEKAGVHPKHIVRVEGGAANVTIATLVALSTAYDTRLRDLFRRR